MSDWRTHIYGAMVELTAALMAGDDIPAVIGRLVGAQEKISDAQEKISDALDMLVDLDAERTYGAGAGDRNPDVLGRSGSVLDHGSDPGA